MQGEDGGGSALSEEESHTINLLSFLTNTDPLRDLRDPSPKVLKAITRLLDYYGAEISGLGLFIASERLCLPDLGAAIRDSESVTAFSLGCAYRMKRGKKRPVTQMLLEILRNNASLESLSLHDTYLNADDIRLATEAIHESAPSRLSNLSLYLCNVEPGLLTCLAGIHTLQSLSLGNSGLEEQGFKELIKAWDSWPMLEELQLREERLYLGNTKILGEGFAAGGANIARLRVLDLSRNCLRDEGIADLVDGLLECYSRRNGQKGDSALETLNLSETKVSPEGSLEICKLVQHSPHLKRLNIRETRLDDDGGIALGKALKSCAKTLESLDVGKCSLASKGVVAICHSLHRLISLKMDCNSAGELGIRAVSEQLLQSNSLSELDLGWNDLTEASARELAKGLSCNDSLLNLRLDFNPLAENGAAAIFDSCRGASPLREIHVSGCGIGNVGAEALARFVLRSTAVREIEVSRNGIGVRGIKAIVQAVAGSVSVEKLDIYGNSVGQEGAKEIAEKLIKSSATLRELNIVAIEMKDEGAVAVVSAVENRRKESVLETVKVGMTDFAHDRAGRGALQNAAEESTRRIIQIC